jgi:hydrogenase nickel incorporation protein HypA/HybF
MHELSIALSILEIAEEESRRRNSAQIAAIHLKLGPLAGVVKEALLSAYEMACETSPLSACKLVIEDVPIIVYCPACRKESGVPSVQEMQCSVCGTPTPQVLRGRELEISAMEICQ